MTTISLDGINDARQRIKDLIHETPIISSELINRIADCEVFFKCEHLQKTGSFKARGATNAVKILKKEGKVEGVITHSSGNHGQALAWAARQVGLPCCVVVPKNAPQLKIDAMRDYGARVELCDNTIFARESGCAKFSKELNYGVVEPFDEPMVIHGQGTLGAEIVDQVPDCDAVFVAVGGGGMASGVAKYIGETKPEVKVFLVEPEDKKLGNYLKSGEFTNDTDTLTTIADGIRVLKKYCQYNVISVTEEEIHKALKLIWTRTKQRVEPAAAVPLAGLLKINPSEHNIRKAVVVLCGGNVDLDFIP